MQCRCGPRTAQHVVGEHDEDKEEDTPRASSHTQDEAMNTNGLVANLNTIRLVDEKILHPKQAP
eukprot:2894869-Amphidinium_carterae.3